MVDSVYRTRSLGVGVVGLPDQYADGKAAKVWQLYIGDTRSRTEEYKSWVLSLLRKHEVQKVLDVACGTGVDSIMLVEEGFKVVSVDASDKMLKYALKERWERRKEPAFDNWVIEEANWLTLPDDVKKPGDGFDAVICLGNSFAHLPDFKGDQSDQKLALQNIASMSDLKQDISTSVLWVNSKPHMITLDYTLVLPQPEDVQTPPDTRYCDRLIQGTLVGKFRLSYYPHRLDSFKEILRASFFGKCEHNVYGDFKQYTPGQGEVPCYFIHVVKKTT
ncbi:Glycine N-methyltransferase [Labeo rohita]|uniref:Glycine N-methyltransferase n=1 Tax=Labeo rohita TaxID=84645 RepID=A0ABQ8LXI7_LABRO|nr:Glycine N-methyltransferase [Labeo rohita]